MHSCWHIVGRVLLVAFTFWALAMIVPDFYRLYQPLGSFGFYANNDGIITDVRGPFLDQTASPAFRAGLRVGDRLDLEQMRCISINTLRCASAMAALGGFRLVTNLQRADLVMAAAPGRSARQVDLVADQRPYNGWVLAVLGTRSGRSDASHFGSRMACLDKTRNYDLGIFPLRYLVQSGPVRGILCALATVLTYRPADAEHSGRHSAGHRFSRLHL